MESSRNVPCLLALIYFPPDQFCDFPLQIQRRRRRKRIRWTSTIAHYSIDLCSAERSLWTGFIGCPGITHQLLALGCRRLPCPHVCRRVPHARCSRLDLEFPAQVRLGISEHGSESGRGWVPADLWDVVDKSFSARRAPGKFQLR